jgi:hypothetical protein
MWFNIFCYCSMWVGFVLFIGSVIAMTGAGESGDSGKWLTIRRGGRYGLFFMVLGLIFLIGGPANAGLKRIPNTDGTIQLAQVAMWPGQDIKFCNGMGAINGGGIVCFHDIVDERIEMTFMNPGWHQTFWGTGTAASLLTSLCRISNINRVTETVFEPGLVRVRTIPCSTGKSGVWIVVETSNHDT